VNVCWLGVVDNEEERGSIAGHNHPHGGLRSCREGGGKFGGAGPNAWLSASGGEVKVGGRVLKSSYERRAVSIRNGPCWGVWPE
jgi:hypothetical protein